MFIIRSILLTLLTPALIYATHPGLYWWAPLVNRSGLYSASFDQISSKWGFGWLGVHYRFFPKVGITVSTYEFGDYKTTVRTFSDPCVYDAVVKIDLKKVHLHKKIAHIYLQTGVWGAGTTLVEEKRTIKGSGGILGIGGYVDLSSLFFVDCSYKGLISVPIFKSQNMSNMNVFSLGLGIRLL